jgi:diguanylate cyclase (GGDEF)-like protein
MKWVYENWRLATVVLTALAATAAFHLVGERMNLLSASLFGALPVALAARLFGWRVALATLFIEFLGNLDLMITSTEGDVVSREEIVLGLTLCVIGLGAGAALADKQRVNQSLLIEPVTGLANREALVREMARLMKTGDHRVTLAMVHVPDLTEISETFGYEVGVELLRIITARIRDVAGSNGLAVKGVRDLFAIVWAAQPLEDDQVARAMIAAASGTFELRGVTLQVSAHASVGRWSVTGGTEPDDIIRSTQRALDKAKQNGREWHSAERATEQGRSRLEIVSELRVAIAGGQLRLHYQPIFELPSRKLRGFEALVRWDHPIRGLVAPSEFIPLAEQSGLIVQLTEWVLNEVMRQMHRWDAIGLRPQIAVNVGAKALATTARLPEVVDHLLGSYGVDPARIVIEVTESDVMTDPTRSIAVLNALKSLGLRIEVDDFGTGYSSLSYLRQLPLDGVKIDRSFMRTLLTDANTSAIVRAAIDLSHALGLEAVAEGVEDEASLERLIATGCDSAQGFFFARPMPADTVPAWLAITGGAVVETESELMPALVDNKKATVLLVDDEPRLRLSTHRMLSAGGFQVISAATASEALQIYSAQMDNVDLVLTDMHLTDWRGHELAARMREIRPDLRVVFMSGDTSELRNAGPDQFLAKPFSKRDLLQGIGQALVV